MDIKSLTTRSLSGIIYVALIVSCVVFGEFTMFCLAFLLGALATVEFFKISHRDDWREGRTTLIVDLLAVFALIVLPLGLPLLVFIGLILVRLIMELYVKSNTPLRNAALSLMTYLYIGLPLGLMMFVFNITRSTMSLLPVFLLIWINDTGAFLVGSTIGKHRLFERISPKKSWEGFFGGLILNTIASTLFGLFLATQFSMNYGLWFWIGLGPLVTVFATWGDLFESLYKRNLHLKDSGNLIPGHGGILDRIDSLLFVMPAVLLYIIAFDLPSFFI